MLDIVAIGDCVVDLIVKIPSLPVKSEDVIVAEDFTRQGGGMCNFLITASRLGLKVGVIDRLGGDDHGRFILNLLARERVDTSRIKCVGEEYTTSVFHNSIFSRCYGEEEETSYAQEKIFILISFRFFSFSINLRRND